MMEVRVVIATVVWVNYTTLSSGEVLIGDTRLRIKFVGQALGFKIGDSITVGNPGESHSSIRAHLERWDRRALTPASRRA